MPSSVMDPPVNDREPEALVLLPGALIEPSPELIDRLGVSRRRVVALTYPAATRMTDLVDAIAAQLAAAGVRRADMMGSSYGGWVAQCLVRRHPDLVRHLILLHTFALRPTDAWRFRLGIRLWRAIPGSLLRRLLSLRVRSMLRPLQKASPAEYDRLTASVSDAIRSPSTADALLRQNECMLESCSSFAVAPADLARHDGRVLIIESDDDPAIRAGDRARLRAMYPGAKVRTFHGTGHFTAAVAPQAFADAVSEFLATAG
jgi:maspardin